MTLTENTVVILLFKQRRQALELKGHGDPGIELLDQFVYIHGIAAGGLQCGAAGCKKMGIVRIDDVFICQAQSADESLLELRQKVQRPAQKSHTAPDGLAAGKTRDGLVYHCLKDGGGEIGGGCPLVDERLNIRFGKDAAAGGDGVELLIISRRVVEACGIGLQKGRHLVDEGAGAAGADAVHALLRRVTEIRDFGILADPVSDHPQNSVSVRKHP